MFDGRLVIDLKGVMGPLLTTPRGYLLNGDNYRLITKRRIDILGFERIRKWGLAHTLLSAWWGIEDNPAGIIHSLLQG